MSTAFSNTASYREYRSSKPEKKWSRASDAARAISNGAALKKVDAIGTSLEKITSTLELSTVLTSEASSASKGLLTEAIEVLDICMLAEKVLGRESSVMLPKDGEILSAAERFEWTIVALQQAKYTLKGMIEIQATILKTGAAVQKTMETLTYAATDAEITLGSDVSVVKVAPRTDEFISLINLCKQVKLIDPPLLLEI